MPDKSAAEAANKSSTAARKPPAGAQASRRQATPVHPVAALLRAMSISPSKLSASDILTLQHTAGNRAVAQLLAQSPPPEPPSDDRQRRLTLQARLAVGAADDPYEREADRTAAEVMRTSAPSVPHVQRRLADEKDEEERIQSKPLASSITPLVQRQAMPEDEKDEKDVPVQRLGAAGLSSVEPGLEQSIERARSGGQPLPGELRERMEQSFGADFSRVRVHADGESDRLNRSLEARAFTSGHDLFFKRGEYNSGSAEGQRLIAHELTHVIQQNKAATAVVTELKPHGKARTINLSRAGNVLIQRTNGTGTATAHVAQPASQLAGYDKDEEDERLITLKQFLALESNRRANALLSELAEEYEAAWAIARTVGRSQWKSSLWAREVARFETARKKLKDALKQVTGIDVAAKALETRQTELKARLDPHKKIEEALDETIYGGKASWMLSYNDDKKQELKDKHTQIKPIVTRENREWLQLETARQNLTEIKLTESKEGERATLAREITEANTARVTPNDETEKGYFKAAEDFIKAMEKKMDDTNKSMIETAMDKKNEYLDITNEQIDGIKAKWKDGKMYKNVAEARVKAAAKIQHEPTQDAWFTKLGLANKAGTYNWLDSGKVGGDNVHETLFHAQVKAKDVVKPAIADLQKEVLGEGVTGYHITLETTTDSGRNSHVYRGDSRIRYAGYKEKYSDDKGALKPGALTRHELRIALRDKRDVCVARVEGSVKDAQDNKGRGMMTADVTKKLEEE